MPALIVLAYISLITLGLIDNVRGPFFPEVLRDLQLNGTQGSAFFAVVSLMAFVSSLSAHRLLKRFSTHGLLLFGSIIFGVGFGLVSRSSTLWQLSASCAVLGWGFGTLNVTQNVLVCEVSTAQTRRRWLSGLHSMYGISALVAPLLATFARELGFTWRDVFLGLAILPISVAVLGSWRKGAVVAAPVRADPLTRAEWSRCFMLAMLMAFYLWGELSASTRLVLWLRQERGFSPSSADFLLAAFFLALLGGRLVFTFIHFPRLSNWLVLGLSAGGGAFFYWGGLNWSPWLLVFAGLVMSPFYPVIMDQTSQIFGDKAPQALSWIIGIGSLSVVLMHIVIGWMSDHYGLTIALHCGAAALFLVAVACVPANLTRSPS